MKDGRKTIYSRNNMARRYRNSVCALLAAPYTVLLLGACALPRLVAVPEQNTSEAQIFNMPNARFYLDSVGIAALGREAMASVERERAYAAAHGKRTIPPTVSFLALSGGGDDGAFGAGLLVGWSQHGTRPSFKLVTGISTGALTAPFAFLGSNYDPVLREIYTQTSASRIFAKLPILSGLTADAMADSAPLLQMITHHLTDDVIAGIADEYRKGRLLLVATTNLDAGRPVIWNLGAIAYAHPRQSREMIAKILLASAAIPAAFPPVLLDVEIDGRRYQEMHVDGGATAQSFLYPAALTSSRQTVARRRAAYIIRNGHLAVPWQQVDRATLAIAKRAMSTLVAAGGVDDLYRIYSTTKRDGVEFNLAYIGDDFSTAYKGPFDLEYMNALFDYGLELGRRGYDWRKSPPAMLPAATLVINATMRLDHSPIAGNGLPTHH